MLTPMRNPRVETRYACLHAGSSNDCLKHDCTCVQASDVLDKLAQFREKLRTTNNSTIGSTPTTGQDVLKLLLPHSKHKSGTQDPTILTLADALAASIATTSCLHTQVTHTQTQLATLQTNTKDLEGYRNVVTSLLQADKEKSTQLSEQAELLTMLSAYVKEQDTADTDAHTKANLQSAYTQLVGKLESVTEERNDLHNQRQVLLKELSVRPSVEQVFDLETMCATLKQQVQFHVSLTDGLLSLTPNAETQTYTHTDVAAAITNATNQLAHKHGLEVAILTQQRNAQQRQLTELAHQVEILTNKHNQADSDTQASAAFGANTNTAWTAHTLKEWRANNPLIVCEVAAGHIVLPENTLLPSAPYNHTSTNTESDTRELGALATDYSPVNASVRIAELQQALMRCHERVSAQEQTLAQAQQYIAFQQQQIQEFQELQLQLQQPQSYPSNGHASHTHSSPGVDGTSNTQELSDRIAELETELQEAIDLRDQYFHRLEAGAVYVQTLRAELEAARQGGSNDPSNPNQRPEEDDDDDAVTTQLREQVAHYEQQLRAGSAYLHDLANQLTLKTNENEELKAALEESLQQLRANTQSSGGGGAGGDANTHAAVSVDTLTKMHQYEQEIAAGTQYLNELSARLTAQINENQLLKSQLDKHGIAHTPDQQSIHIASPPLSTHSSPVKQQSNTNTNTHTNSDHEDNDEDNDEGNEEGQAQSLELQIEELRSELEEAHDLNEKYLAKLKKGSEVLTTERETSAQLRTHIAELEHTLSETQSTLRTQERTIQTLTHTLTQLKEENAQLLMDMQTHTQQQADTQTAFMDEQTHTLDEQTHDMEALQAELEELRATNEVYLTKLHRGSEYLQTLRQQFADTQAQTHTEMEALTARIRELEEANTQLLSAHTQAEEGTDTQQHTQELEQDLAELRNKHAHTQSQLDSLQTHIATLEAQLTHTQQQADTHKQEASSWNDKWQDAMAELAVLSATCEQTHTEVQHLRTHNAELQAQVESVSAHTQADHTQLVHTQEQLTHTQTQLNKVKEQLDTMYTKCADLEAENSLLRTQVQDLTNKHATLVDQHTLLEQTHTQTEIEFTELQRVNTQLTAQTHTLMEECAHYKESSDREANTLAMLRQANVELQLRVDTLTQDLQTLEQTHTQEQTHRQEEQAHTQQQRTEELEAELESLREELANTQQLSETYLEKLKAGSAYVEKLKQTITTQTQECAQLRLEIQALQADINAHTPTTPHTPHTPSTPYDRDEVVQTLQQQLQTYEERMKRGSDMLKSLRTDMSAKVEENTRLSGLVNTQQTQLDTLTVELEAVRTQYVTLLNNTSNNANAKLVPLENSLRAYQVELSALRQQLANIDIDDTHTSGLDNNDESNVGGGGGDDGDVSFALSEGVEFVDMDDFDVASVMNESGIGLFTNAGSPIRMNPRQGQAAVATAGGSAYAFTVDYSDDRNEGPHTPIIRAAGGGVGLGANARRSNNANATGTHAAAASLQPSDVSPMVQYNAIYPDAVSSSPRVQSKSDIQIAGAVSARRNLLRSGGGKKGNEDAGMENFEELDKKELIRRLLVLKAAVAAKEEVIATTNATKQSSTAARSINTVSPVTVTESAESIQLKNVLIRLSDLAFHSHLRISQLRSELASVKTKYSALVAMNDTEHRLNEKLASQLGAGDISVSLDYEHTFPDTARAIHEAEDEIFKSTANPLKQRPQAQGNKFQSKKSVSLAAGAAAGSPAGTPIKSLSYGGADSPVSTPLPSLLSSAAAKASVDTIRKDYTQALRAKQQADQLLVDKEFQLKKLSEQLEATKNALAAANAAKSLEATAAATPEKETSRMSIRHLSQSRRMSGGAGGTGDSPQSSGANMSTKSDGDSNNSSAELQKLKTELDHVVHDLVDSKIMVAQLSADLEIARKELNTVKQKFKEASRSNVMLQSALDAASEKVTELEASQNKSMFGKFPFSR
jgi:chromosome segregation ATPase